MFPELKTARLRLREITQVDATDIFQTFSDNRVTKLYGLKTFVKLEEANQLIDAFATNFQHKRGIRWGIERKDEKGLIGTIGLNGWAPAHRRAEIGYEIQPAFWRQGYAAEALQAIVAYSFQELELTRLAAIVFTENEASNQLLRNYGFVHEGTLKNYIYQHDVPHDVHVYAITEYEKKMKKG